MQIIILGMHRSGTSAFTRLINMMGAYLGPEGSQPEFTPANPKGFWERFDVYTLNDALLDTKQCAWYSLKDWRFEQSGQTPPNIAAAMKKIIDEMNRFKPWVMKDPRLSLLLPAWRPYLDNPVTVIVYRDPREIAMSLYIRNKIPPAYGLALWKYYAVGLLNATLDMPRVFAEHLALMQRPVKTCEALLHELEASGVRKLTMPGIPAIREFIDPELYRAKANGKIPMLSPWQQGLAEMIQGMRTQIEPVRVSEPSQSLIQAGSPVNIPTPIIMPA